MSRFSQSLKQQLTSGFPEGNPLVAIGVSAQVLDLGLNEDDLYDYITKDVARRLVMRFHPDRVDPSKQAEVKTLQERHAEAYEKLQDRATFTRALSEFRNLKAEERTETRQLRQSLRSLREMLDSYRDKELSQVQASREIERERFTLQRTIAEQDRVVPELEGKVESLEEKLDNLRSTSIIRRKRFMDVFRYLSRLCEDSPNVRTHAFEAKWVVIAAPVFGHAKEVPLPTTSTGKWKRDFLRSVKHLQIPVRTMREIKDGWTEAMAIFNSSRQTRSEKILSLRLHVLELQSGKPKVIYGWKNVIRGGRVIGSIPCSSTKVDREELVRLVNRDRMLEHLVPFLSVGKLLVSQRIKKFDEKKKEGESFPFVWRETRQLILAVS